MKQEVDDQVDSDLEGAAGMLVRHGLRKGRSGVLRISSHQRSRGDREVRSWEGRKRAGYRSWGRRVVRGPFSFAIAAGKGPIDPHDPKSEEKSGTRSVVLARAADRPDPQRPATPAHRRETPRCRRDTYIP